MRLISLFVIAAAATTLLAAMPEGLGAQQKAAASRRAAASQARQLPRCLDYRPSVVELTGRIVSESYAGPPHYESLARGDRPEKLWFLVLAKPVCVGQDLHDPDMNPGEKKVTKLQLVFPGVDDPGDLAIGETIQKLTGKRARVMGTLFGAEGPNQHTPVLLTVSRIVKTI